MNQEGFLKELTKYKNGKPELLHETTAVLAYEVGSMLQQAMYIYWFGHDLARLGYYKSELIDAIAQLVLICESIGVDFEEMKKLGIEKAIERFRRK